MEARRAAPREGWEKAGCRRAGMQHVCPEGNEGAMHRMRDAGGAGIARRANSLRSRDRGVVCALHAASREDARALGATPRGPGAGRGTPVAASDVTRRRERARRESADGTGDARFPGCGAARMRSRCTSSSGGLALALLLLGAPCRSQVAPQGAPQVPPAAPPAASPPAPRPASQELRTTRFETRGELEAAAEAAEQQHRNAEAWLLRTRLRRGDFQEGDRIVVMIDVPGLPAADPASPRGASSASGDTLILRAGKVAQFAMLPTIPDLSLDGVLRSELGDTISAHLRKYLRNPTVRATPLVRLAVMGAVGRPGWYATPTDVVLADVIMQAGGVSAEADVANTVVKRAGEVIWSASEVRVALADGLSLDRLHLRAGDEVFVGSRKRFGVGTALQLVTAVVGIYATTQALHR